MISFTVDGFSLFALFDVTEAPQVCAACLHPQGYFISEGIVSRCDTSEGFCEYTNKD